jgi:uncharacterized membrane protein YhiD involved in acid resistance
MEQVITIYPSVLGGTIFLAFGLGLIVGYYVEKKRKKAGHERRTRS